MNIVTLTGNATKDVELRYTGTGKAIANGTIAVRRSFKNANGEYESDFINFVCWGKAGETLANYVRKGNHFGITGELQTRNYEKDGRKVYVTEVNVTGFDLPKKSNNEGHSSSNQSNTQYKQNTNDTDPFKEDGTPIDISDDDLLPF